MSAPKIVSGAVTTPGSLEKTTIAPRLELTVLREANAEVLRSSVVDGDEARIGAHPTNDVVVTDPLVSRFHFRVARERGAWRITDTGSLNGTRIEGVVVRDADLPSPEATISFGDSQVRIRELVATKEVPLLDRPSFGSLYGTSVAMRKLFAVLERVAASDSHVLIEGESGTGKELATAEIVRRGPRARAPFVVVDCSAIPANLIESTLLGHARGSFTGADRERIGAFEAADGGTVFLDEIGELPMELQPKLLRVLESKTVQRIGEHKGKTVDVRVVAATNRSLEREMNAGRFREDLYFRLSVVVIRLPPLRERLDDLPILLDALLDSLDARDQRKLFTPEVLSELARHRWPGNVRELRNFVERAIVMQEAGKPSARPASARSEASEIDLDVPFSDAKDSLVAGFERAYIAELLRWSDGNVTRAAKRAKLDRIHLHRLIARHELKPGRSFRD